MKIAFEANVLTSPYTGIAKSLINLIKHIKDTEIILFTNNNKKIKLDLGFKYIFIIFMDYSFILSILIKIFRLYEILNFINKLFVSFF